MASHLWKFIRHLVATNTVDSNKDAAEAVLGLAEVLATDGANGQKLAPLIMQLNSLHDALAAPLHKIAGAKLSFLPIGTGLLQFYAEQTKREPTIAQSVALVSQAAYLETVKALLNQPRLKAWLAAVGDRTASEQTQRKLNALHTFQLGDIEARHALQYFHESKLATLYGEVLITRLRELGAPPEQAAKVTAQLAQATNRLVMPALVKRSSSVRTLIEWHQTQGDVVFDKYIGIDAHLEEWIASCLHKPVFSESFSLEDIYVPLRAQPLTVTGEADTPLEAVELEQWAWQTLNDENQKARVMFVQGKPGQGKSTFCQMFANWIRRHEYPRWIPLLIRLQDLTTVSEDFEETLARAVNRDFSDPNSDWLTDPNLKFLFLLDGFDELPLQDSAGGRRDFLEQVGWFQRQCARDAAKGHRVLITGHPLILQESDHRLFNHLSRVEILPMDDELQSQWIDRWSTVTGQDPTHLINTLRDPNLPEKVQALSREPLTLYLLSAMYRDGELQVEKLTRVENNAANVAIYAQALHWLAKKQRPEWSHALAKLEPTGLRRVLQEAGLCMLQSGRSSVPFKTMAVRLTGDEAAAAVLAEAQNCLESGDMLQNGLARFGPESFSPESFSPQSGQPQLGAIAFAHRSFGEFLCAERLVKSLIAMGQMGGDREDAVPDSEFCWTMYDLVGCRVLTPKIVEYTMVLLIYHPHFNAAQLHKRLYDFYWRWSQGEFMDSPSETLPQQKMRLLQAGASQQTETIGQGQIDVYTGLNTMILLWELHRYGLALSESPTSQNSEDPQNLPFFHPCMPRNQEEFDAQQLLRIIGMSQCLGASAFRTQVGFFLHEVNFRGTDLQGVDLRGANLQGADLRKTKLNGADLSNTDCSNADLINADLSEANLRNAVLSSARLFSANLSSTILRGANFNGANLNRANFSDADLRNVYFKGAGLIRVNLCNANLRSANLDGANLGRADLRNADLRKATLNEADLCNAMLCNANLGSADLRNVILSDANLDFANLNSADLRNANLSSARLSSADLRNVDFEEANLSGANLFAVKLFEANGYKADLSEANLFKAQLGSAGLVEANLRNTVLSHANLFGTDLSGADLSHADLFEANLSSINLSNGSLSSADLRSASLVEANLYRADLSHADLFNTNLDSADLRGADLSGANLVGTDLTNAFLSDEEDTLKWDQDTQWENVKGLDRAFGVPEDLLQHLGLVRAPQK